MSKFGKVGWGDDSDEDDSFYKLSNPKSLCNSATSNFKKTLFERHTKQVDETPNPKPHKNDYICNNTNKHIYKIRDTYFHLDKLKRAYIICSPHKHVNIIFG